LRSHSLVAVLLFLCFTVPVADAAVKTETKITFGLWFATFPSVTPTKEYKEIVAVKDNRRLFISEPLNRIIHQITDLDEEKIYEMDEKVYDSDVRERSYRITTFEEVRQRIQKTQDNAKQGTQEKLAQVDFELHESGLKKNINGYDCREVVMTSAAHEQGKTLEESGGIVLTAHVWLAPKIDAMKEIDDFSRRYVQKLAAPNSPPGVEQARADRERYLMPAMRRLQTETAKLDGTAILKITTTEFVEDAAVSARLRNSQEQGNASPARGAITALEQELLKVSTEVDDADLAIPAGFKEKK
jgi:hypothetical protein